MRAGALAAAGLAAGAFLLARPATFGAPAPVRRRVSVVVPARDEEVAIGHLLASLSTQTRRADEVIVVDDASSDGTAAVAAGWGATVLRSGGPPEGWSGKCWALQQGQAAATGDLLVFLDADVRLSPGALARIAAEHDRLGGAGLVSAEPWHRADRPVEHLSLVANVVALMGTGAFSARRRRATARVPVAFGPCLAVDRVTYDAAGGHAHPDVRARICEDLYLARAVAAIGRPVGVFAGRDVVAMRMYPDGARQAFDGWTKVLATGAAGVDRRAAVATAVWVTGAVAATRRPGTYAAYALQLAWFGRVAGSFNPAAAALFPLPLGFFVAASARSALKAGTRRPLAWRGRSLTGRPERR